MTKMYRCSACVPDKELFLPGFKGKIYFEEYHVISQTKCGVWISLYPDKKKFINTTLRKQFAYATKEHALEAFIKRKERHIAILERQLEEAKDALCLALEYDGVVLPPLVKNLY
jgi:hypothetical protein